MPPFASVRYNDWRHIDVAPFRDFKPDLPVSVIVPYFEAPRALGLTLAALERQTWPRALYEVVIVDDGSRVPLEPPGTTRLNVTVVRQEDRGFGAARARNTGVRAAVHDILLFLDGDMLPEAGWLAAHARWHHAAGGLLTLGFRGHVGADGLDPDRIRNRSGSLREVFAGQDVDPSWVEPHMRRTRDLTSRDDDPFKVVVSANLGIRRDLYELTGGFDESFTRWGSEDTEFGYRVYTHGGVLVPVREAFAWHQGRWAEGRSRKRASLQRQGPKLAHLIAHRAFRPAAGGRIFAVPQYVVTVRAAEGPAARIVETTEDVLADGEHDLVVRIRMPETDERCGWLRDQFDPDPRVRLCATGSVLDAFPAAPFHVTLPAGARFASGLVRRLRTRLGTAVQLTAVLDDEPRVSITRAWALHRARRTGRDAAEFGDVVTVPGWRLRIGSDSGPGLFSRMFGARRAFRRSRGGR